MSEKIQNRAIGSTERDQKLISLHEIQLNGAMASLGYVPNLNFYLIAIVTKICETQCPT